MEKTDRILVTGASGMIGSALVRLLKERGFENVLAPAHSELDCRIQQGVGLYFAVTKPDYVFHLAAKVGGIKSNSDKSADFIYDNTIMQCNVINAAHGVGVKKLLFPGSACAYPVLDRPIKESDFMMGKPEETNIAYAAAKINGIIMAQSYAKQYGMNVVLPMVANAYGLHDRSDHVIPMMIKKFREGGDVVELWGTGKPLREFIYADDVADAFLFLMENYNSPEIINVGSVEEMSIEELATNIDRTLNYSGDIFWNKTQPDGIMRKRLDSSKLFAMGWRPKVGLEEGLKRVMAA